jgi:mRNA interferase HigB
MRVINEPAIVRFARKHADSRQWLENWLIVTRSAHWRTIQDLQLAYPAADGGVKGRSGARVTVFDVGGNKYRMVTDVIYAIGTIIVLELMVHAEYSKNRWKNRY